MNSILIQRHVPKVLYIQRVAELVRLVTGLRTASPVSSPASSPDVQHFDIYRRCSEGSLPNGHASGRCHRFATSRRASLLDTQLLRFRKARGCPQTKRLTTGWMKAKTASSKTRLREHQNYRHHLHQQVHWSPTSCFHPKRPGR